MALDIVCEEQPGGQDQTGTGTEIVSEVDSSMWEEECHE